MQTETDVQTDNDMMLLLLYIRIGVTTRRFNLASFGLIDSTYEF